MSKGFIVGLAILFFPFCSFAAGDYIPESVGAGKPEVHINNDGTIQVKSGKVDQIVGTTLYLGVRWGSLPMRFTMKTDARTMVTKRYGGTSSVSSINLGDYIDVEGEFLVGSDFFGVNALKVKDWSLQEESGVFSGVIVEMNSSSFMLRTPQQQTITVRLATSSVIKKGVTDIPFARLRKGDAIPRANGVFDYSTNMLTAGNLIVYQAKTNFLPRNFEGTLKQVVSTTPPASLIVTVGGADYTVKMSDKTIVQKKNRTAGQLARFVVGDTIRFYGAIREEENILTDALIVDAEVVRNLGL